MTDYSKLFLFFIIFSLLLAIAAGLVIHQDLFSWVKNKGGDFLVHWLAVRAFGKENLSPYSPAVQSATETLVNGEVKSQGGKGLKFSSPLYSVIFILPFALVGDAQTAQLIWLVFLEIVLLGSLWTCLRLTDWKPVVWLLFLVIAFAMFSYHNLQALGSGRLIVISSFFIFSSLIAIRSGRYEVAGILLAFATMQPRAVLLVILFVLVWATSKHLWSLVVWFFAGVAILAIIGILFIPDWPIQYIRTLFNYKDYYQVITPVSVFSSGLPGMGRQLGWGLSLLMGIILISEWLAARKKDFNWFLWTVSLTLVASQWIGIPSDPDDFVLLLLPFVLVLAAWDRRFSHLGKWLAGFSLLILLSGLWVIFIMTYPSLNPFQQRQLFLFPLPFFLIIGLYWVRWWAIKPPMDYIEEIRKVDRF